MIKRVVLLLITMAFISCNSTQPVVRTSKPVYRKPNTATAKAHRKPATTNRNGRPVVVDNPITSKAPTQTQEIKKIEQKYESAKEENKSSSKTSVYSKSEILEATTRVKVTTAMVLDYISQYQDIAKKNMSQYGIPASITLGQGILESGAGTGPLSILANNHFGIKCHKEWTGPSVKYDDDEAQECFRKYEQPSQSYQDHSLFLTSRPRYFSLFEIEEGDYKQWAKGLKDAGYATDPKYPEKLIGIIERYQLAKYDAEVLGIAFEPINTTNQNLPLKGNRVIPSSHSYQVTQGDTLYSISKRFNITVDDLKKKNDIQNNAISIGQNLIIK